MPDAKSRLVLSFIEDALSDLDAARRLAAPSLNRHASFHLQQAAEKLAKAVLIGRGIAPGAEHRIGMLLMKLADDDPWRERLAHLDRLSAFATAYRYPTPSGRIGRGLDSDDVIRTADSVEALLNLLKDGLPLP